MVTYIINFLKIWALILSEKFVALSLSMAVYLGQLTYGDAMRGVYIYLHSVV